MRNFFYILIAVISLFTVSCEDDKIVSSSDVKLDFSVDAIRFDTVFTTVGSTTQHLKIYNPYDQKILISSIRLATGNNSSFKLNINGVPANELFDVEILPKDSIYVFVEVTIDPMGMDLPFIVRDSIEFVTNANLQDVDLVAWGQDVVLVRENITRSETWTAQKPYLVNSNIRVDSSAVLTIDPGTHIYFHHGTGLYVKGKVVAGGTREQPVIFQGDRLEDVYQNMPDQWNGILLLSGSHENQLNYTEIKNANIGLQVGTIENDGFASVVLSNSRISNHAYAGIFALKSKIRAYNCLISNCGSYAAALLVGGEYEFYQSTIANYRSGFSAPSRSTSSLMISDHVIIEKENGENVKVSGILDKAYFANCIITGNLTSGNELELAKAGEATFNYRFDHCLIQVADTFNVRDVTHYKAILKGVDPRFTNPGLNFELDTLSPAKDAGSPEIGRLFPFDLLNQSRTSDAAPDLGAYERIERISD